MHFSKTQVILQAKIQAKNVSIELPHSNDASQYHYHLTPECIDGAADNSTCLHLGYMDDGFPVYGQCSTYRVVKQAFTPGKSLEKPYSFLVCLTFSIDFTNVKKSR